jgi:peptidoglycan-associated lipoprotein
MRMLFALPVAVLFGCAHQSGSEYKASSAQPAAQTAEAQAQEKTAEAAAAPAAAQPAVEPAATEAAAAPAAAQASSQAMPQPVAGADPSSSANTCGLVRVKFETDKWDLKDSDKALLTATADCLKTNHQLRVNIEGNADERGTQEHNKMLSEERSKVVSEFLKTQGVSAEQIQQLSFGEDNPRCTQSSAACWAKNRRTAIRPTCKM